MSVTGSSMPVRLNQDFMFIDKKKEAHRGSYSYFVEARRPI